MRIIPAVNCHFKDFDCVHKKVKAAETFSGNGFIHLDVADGAFTYNKTWSDLGLWKDLRTNLKLEVHLMVLNPAEVAEAWCFAGAKRIIVHAEVLNEESAKIIADLSQKNGFSRMLALNPETTVQSAENFFKYFMEFQTLAVHPGLAGQKFLPEVLPKIKYLRAKYPSAIIEVDGGINQETAKLAEAAGADFATAASFIFGSRDPKLAFEMLNRA